MRLSEPVLWGVVATLLIALFGTAAYKYQMAEAERPLVRAPMNVGCDLHTQVCRTDLPSGGAVSLSISPHPIPVVQPWKIVVDTSLANVAGIEVDFSGVDMNMGLNRFKLSRAADGRYVGEGMLPVCVRNRMSWEATVLIDAGDRRLAVPYRFDTVGQG